MNIYKVDDNLEVFTLDNLEHSIEHVINARLILNQLVFDFDEPDMNTKMTDKANSILKNLKTISENLSDEKISVKKILESAVSAENNNVAVTDSLMDSVHQAEVTLAGASVSSSYNSADITSSAGPSGLQNANGTDSTATDTDDLNKDENVQLEDDDGIQSDNPADVEIPDEDVDVGLEENVTETEVEAVIDLIYGENPTLTEDEKTRIAEAIVAINETEILEGLEKEPSNIIKSEIIKDYLDGELDLTEISKEDLQEYIDSHPSIKIHFEMAESVESFASLIESGVLTDEQIHTILEENVQICDSEEAFQEAYMNAGGTQTDVSQIQSFYSPEENKIYIRNTVDSTVISNSIICVLGDIMFVDEENGNISYYPVSPELNTDKVIDISIENNISSDSTFTDLDNIVNSSENESDSNLNLSE